MTISLWIGFFTFLFHVLFYLVIIRIPLKMGNLYRQIIQGAVIYFVILAVCLSLVDGFSFWHYSAVYYFGCVIYFFATSVVYTSLSVKTLYLLMNQSDRSLPSEEIHKKCILMPFEERAELLVRDGSAVKEGNLYRITPRGRSNVNRLRRVRKVLGVETVGFYS